MSKGEILKEWEEKPQKQAQKDLDVKFVKKRNKVYHGYKNHVIVNSETKMIEDYEKHERQRMIRQLRQKC